MPQKPNRMNVSFSPRGFFSLKSVLADQLFAASLLAGAAGAELPLVSPDEVLLSLDAALLSPALLLSPESLLSVEPDSLDPDEPLRE